jgi:hypothetical protein
VRVPGLFLKQPVIAGDGLSHLVLFFVDVAQVFQGFLMIGA